MGWWYHGPEGGEPYRQEEEGSRACRQGVRRLHGLAWLDWRGHNYGVWTYQNQVRVKLNYLAPPYADYDLRLYPTCYMCHTCSLPRLTVVIKTCKLGQRGAELSYSPGQPRMDRREVVCFYATKLCSRNHRACNELCTAFGLVAADFPAVRSAVIFSGPFLVVGTYST